MDVHDHNAIQQCTVTQHCIAAVPTAYYSAVQVLSILVRYIVESNDESMAVLGVSLLQQLMQSAVAQIDTKGWDCIVDAFQSGCSFASLETLLSDR